MNKQLLLVLLGLGVVGVVLVGGWRLGQGGMLKIIPANNNTPSVTRSPSPSVGGGGNSEVEKELIVVEVPRENEVIRSPLTVEGRARGNWYFEGDFPIRLVDASGKELGRSVATAQGEWMTENFVPFTSTLTFNVQTAGRGTVILEKSNPSGLDENAQELRIPVSWGAVATRKIQLYYYNKTKDPNVDCDPEAVLPVSRTVPLTQTPIQEAIKLLLRGELSDAEVAQGFETEFPLPGVELKGAVLRDGVLTLEFVDPQNKLSGGSCRVRVLSAEVEKTARQFSEVKSVRFLPVEVFQP